MARRKTDRARRHDTRAADHRARRRAADRRRARTAPPLRHRSGQAVRPQSAHANRRAASVGRLDCTVTSNSRRAMLAGSTAPRSPIPAASRCHEFDLASAASHATMPSAPKAASPTPKSPPPRRPAGKSSTSVHESCASKPRPSHWRLRSRCADRRMVAGVVDQVGLARRLNKDTD